jgi:hypothetical protein
MVRNCIKNLLKGQNLLTLKFKKMKISMIQSSAAHRLVDAAMGKNIWRKHPKKRGGNYETFKFFAA